MDIWIRALAYLCLGITAEILFTGIKSLFNKDWTAQAHTTLWMLPIYFFGLPFIFEPIHLWLLPLHWILRGSFYALGILFVEYIMATIYKWILNKNPWEYTKGWHLHGKIRLDYFPFWAAFGLLLELVHNFLLF